MATSIDFLVEDAHIVAQRIISGLDWNIVNGQDVKFLAQSTENIAVKTLVLGDSFFLRVYNFIAEYVHRERVLIALNELFVKLETATERRSDGRRKSSSFLITALLCLFRRLREGSSVEQRFRQFDCLKLVLATIDIPSDRVQEMMGYLALQVMLLLPNIAEPNIMPEKPSVDVEIIENNLAFIRDSLASGTNRREEFRALFTRKIEYANWLRLLLPKFKSPPNIQIGVEVLSILIGDKAMFYDYLSSQEKPNPDTCKNYGKELHIYMILSELRSLIESLNSAQKAFEFFKEQANQETKALEVARYLPEHLVVSVLQQLWSEIMSTGANQQADPRTMDLLLGVIDHANASEVVDWLSESKVLDGMLQLVHSQRMTPRHMLEIADVTCKKHRAYAEFYPILIERFLIFFLDVTEIEQYRVAAIYGLSKTQGLASEL